MNIDDLKKHYGDEYPAAVVLDGIRMPLQREKRFARKYYSAEHKMGTVISRFMDGSASITVTELRQVWPTLVEIDRIDFCQECKWLHEQSDFKDMLRFIMEHGQPSEWSGIALSVGSHLPQKEAFEFLVRALRATEIGRASNITQAIARTKHPDAEAPLRIHLECVCANRLLWDDDEFLNWAAFDATTCIDHLIELGIPAADFEEKVRRLSQHVCSGNRDSCRNFLSKHYSWLK